MNFFSRLYVSTFISSFGSWLTFLAIALIVKENHGADQVAWVFLVQTLPAILFTRGLADLIPQKYHAQAYFWSQIALAINSIVLCFFSSLFFLYVHLFLGATLKSVANPLFNTLIGKWTPRERLDEIFTNVGSLQTATLALAPALGAWLKIATSANILFLIDAITFVVAAFLIMDRLKVRELAQDDTLNSIGRNFKLSQILGSIVSFPSGVPNRLWIALIAWFCFLGLGALLNALEFVRFEQLNLTESQIGQLLGAWGVGSLLVFLLRTKWPAFISGFVYLSALSLFFLANSFWIGVLTFLIGGWAGGYFSGALRAGIQKAVPEGYNTLPVWSFANQVTQVINLIAYAGVGLLIKTLGFNVFMTCFILIGIATLGFLIKSNQQFRKHEMQVSV